MFQLVYKAIVYVVTLILIVPVGVVPPLTGPLPGPSSGYNAISDVYIRFPRFFSK